MMLVLLFVFLVAFILLRVPIAIAVGAASFIYILGTGNTTPLHTAVQRMASGVNAYTLLAIPFFIFAGNIMNHGGVTTRIFNFAHACVGHDVDALCDALDAARTVSGKPTVILAQCVKGKGIPFMEGKNVWHGNPIGVEQYAEAMAALGGQA